MKVALTIAGFTRLFGGSLPSVLRVARVADEAGIDQLVLADHVVMGPRTDRYPYGTFPYGPEEPWPEPMALLAAMAAVTERVRLATGILISPLRPAVVLAKTTATVDGISGGRLDLGVGLGWQREEYEAGGVPWTERHEVFADQLRACIALWTADPPVEFESKTVSFGPIWCEPRPVQRPIPVWFGTPVDDRYGPLMEELGAGWMPIHTTTREQLAEGIGRLPKGSAVRASVPVKLRDDGTVDADATRAAVAPLAELGVTHASVGLGRSLRDAAEVERFLASLHEVFRPIG